MIASHIPRHKHTWQCLVIIRWWQIGKSYRRRWNQRWNLENEFPFASNHIKFDGYKLTNIINYMTFSYFQILNLNFVMQHRLSILQNFNILLIFLWKKKKKNLRKHVDLPVYNWSVSYLFVYDSFLFPPYRMFPGWYFLPMYLPHHSPPVCSVQNVKE